MKKLVTLMGVSLLVGACGAAGGGGSKSAADADDDGSGDAPKASGKMLEEGTKVCISELVGVRYALEDILREQKLEPAKDCMFADVQLEEKGKPSAWVLRYQKVGEGEWHECKSSENERRDFAEDCIEKMRADLAAK